MYLEYLPFLLIVLAFGIFGVVVFFKPTILYRGKDKEPSEAFIMGKKRQSIILMVLCAALLIYIIYLMATIS